MSTETPLYFAGPGGSLFGILHEPAGDSTAPPFLFCHAFGEEKLWAHRVFVALAREMAGRGRRVLRFDLAGHGDSDGDVERTSLQSHLADIHAAIDFVKARLGAPSVSLLGLRLGATEAALVADTRADVAELVLWQPITDGARYMQELLRVNLTTQLAVDGAVSVDREGLVAQMREGRTVNVDGYDIALPFFDETSAVRLAAGRRTFQGRCLIAQVDRTPAATPSRDLAALQQAYAHAAIVTVQDEPFWKEIKRFYERTDQLVAATLTWLEAA